MKDKILNLLIALLVLAIVIVLYVMTSKFLSSDSISDETYSNHHEYYEDTFARVKTRSGKLVTGKLVEMGEITDNSDLMYVIMIIDNARSVFVANEYDIEILNNDEGIIYGID